MRLLGFSTLWIALSAFTAGCSDSSKGPIGGTCGDAEECLSGLCYDNVCLDPDGDEDQDGLVNSFEISVGSSPYSKDSDEDQIPDPDELGANLELRDTDGDGKPDIIESRIYDSDGDCLPDEYDSDDSAPTADLSLMRPVVCPELGICVTQRESLQVRCTSKGAVCSYELLQGYDALDQDCDGLDSNCNGTIDEGCSEPSRPILSPTGGHRRSSTNYRATLMLGTPAAGSTQSSKHRALLQITPLIQPAQETP